MWAPTYERPPNDYRLLPNYYGHIPPEGTHPTTIGTCLLRAATKLLIAPILFGTHQLTMGNHLLMAPTNILWAHTCLGHSPDYWEHTSSNGTHQIIESAHFLMAPTRLLWVPPSRKSPAKHTLQLLRANVFDGHPSKLRRGPPIIKSTNYLRAHINLKGNRLLELFPPTH